MKREEELAQLSSTVERLMKEKSEGEKSQNKLRESCNLLG